MELNPAGTERQKGNFGAAIGFVDLGAAALSTASANLSGHASFGTGLASGIKWAATGANELTNRDAAHPWPKTRVQTVINTTNSLAGLGSAAAAIATDVTTAGSASATGLGYFSAVNWGVSGAINAFKGAYTAVTTTGRSRVSGGLQALSGAANVAAATYSGLAVQSAANQDTVGATRNATISSALWMGGAVLGIASALVGRPDAPAAPAALAAPADDLEGGHGPGGVSALPLASPVARRASASLAVVGADDLAPARAAFTQPAPSPEPTGLQQPVTAPLAPRPRAPTPPAADFIEPLGRVPTPELQPSAMLPSAAQARAPTPPPASAFTPPLRRSSTPELQPSAMLPPAEQARAPTPPPASVFGLPLQRSSTPELQPSAMQAAVPLARPATPPLALALPQPVPSARPPDVQQVDAPHAISGPIAIAAAPRAVEFMPPVAPSRSPPAQHAFAQLNDALPPARAAHAFAPLHGRSASASLRPPPPPLAPMGAARPRSNSLP